MKQSVLVAALVAALCASASAQPKPETVPRRQHVDPERQVGMEHAKIGEPGALFTVYFHHRSLSLSAEAQAVLEQAAAKLASGSQQIIVAGHTSGIADGGADQKLSEQRANAVRRYLVRHGVAEERIKSIGYGKTQPADTNGTEAGREHNRRVVISAAAADG